MAKLNDEFLQALSGKHTGTASCASLGSEGFQTETQNNVLENNFTSHR